MQCTIVKIGTLIEKLLFGNYLEFNSFGSIDKWSLYTYADYFLIYFYWNIYQTNSFIFGTDNLNNSIILICTTKFAQNFFKC